MKQQRGSAWVIGLVMVAVFGTAIFYLWSDRNEARESLKLAREELAMVKNERDMALEAIVKLQNQVEMKDKLIQASDEVSTVYVKTIKELNAKVDKLTAKLPVVIMKKDEPPATAAQEERSFQRIEVIWEVYCVTSPPLAEPRQDGLGFQEACMLRKDGGI